MSARKDPLHTESLLRIFFFLSVALLVVLGLAPAKSHFTEWRALQGQYNKLVVARGGAPVEVGLKQIWNPRRGFVDRCISCHVGMGDADPIPGHPVFGPHPAIPHETREFGCTSCHQGQGRATSKATAHADGGHVEWDAPMLEKAMTQASCGTCHSTVKVQPFEVVERGRYLFDLHGCLSCHKVGDEGGTVGPDLSGVGLKGFDRAWHVRHLVLPASVVEGSRMMNFGHLTEDELEALIAYMDTLVGAPRVMAGKALANRHGCRGCHTLRGVGGDLGPPLDETGSRKLAHEDRARLGEHPSVAEWQRRHLAAPGALVAGSKMPRPVLTPAEVEDLSTYLMSLRRDRTPLEQLPKAEVVARLEERRDHGDSGEALFGTYCSACHGAAGEGKAIEELGVWVPAVTGSDFLSVASDGFLRHTMRVGRDGRNMPAWGTKNGGLRPGEIEEILKFLRSHEAVPPSLAEVRAAKGDPVRGERLFVGNCSACHGNDGTGTDLAPGVANPDLLATASDEFLYRTVVHGRPGTAMPSHKELSASDVASILAWLDTHRKGPRKDLGDVRAVGSVAYGREVYATQCASCHGADASGGVGPAIGNRHFLGVASDGFLAASIREGRSGRAMKPFGRGRGGIVELEEREIMDVIVYLRSLDPGGEEPIRKGEVKGDVAAGKQNFAAMCAGCHGAGGKGGFAPSLANPGFLAAASDGFLQATILKGRAGTAMRSWGNHGFAELSPRDVNDLTAYIRSLERKDTP